MTGRNGGPAQLARRARWYGNRLLAMSGAEIVHRVGEQRRRLVSRVALPRAVRDWSGEGVALPVWPGLAEGVRRLAADAALREAWAAHSETVRAGRFRFLGADWPEAPERGAPPDWHRDPMTGRRWPDDVYCFDVPFRDAEAFGDVKHAWELGRLQYLQPVAAHAVVADDAGAAELCLRHLQAWIEGNPPYRGVHWAFGIELAFRVVSIVVVTSLVGERLDAPGRAAIARSLHQHGWWIERFPSLHSSANNHLVAEAAALFLLGTLTPALPGAERHRDRGRAILVEQVPLQIHADGVGAEQSPAYLALTLDWLLLTGDLANRAGAPFPSSFWERVGAAARFLRWISDEDGNQPRIGDDDESRVLVNGMGPEPTVSSVLGCAAAATRQPELAPPDSVGHLRNALVPAPAPGSAGPEGVRHFAEGGYTVARVASSSPALPAHLLVFDHGPVGYPSLAAHGHADTLAIWLHVEGRAVLIDAGTHLYYHGDPAWRDHFRSSAAHNTLSLDGAGSSEPSGPFGWARKAQTRVVSFDGGDDWCVEAEHDGFRASHGVAHRRRLERLAPGHYGLTDRLVGTEGARAVEIGFLVSPELAVEAWPRGFRIRDGDALLLAIEHEGELVGRVECGRLAPPRGWHSPQFGVREPAPRIVFGGDVAPGQPLHFRLAVGEPAP